MALGNITPLLPTDRTRFDSPQIYSVPRRAQNTSGKSDSPEAEESKGTISSGTEKANRANKSSARLILVFEDWRFRRSR